MDARPLGRRREPGVRTRSGVHATVQGRAAPGREAAGGTLGVVRDHGAPMIELSPAEKSQVRRAQLSIRTAIHKLALAYGELCRLDDGERDAGDRAWELLSSVEDTDLAALREYSRALRQR